MRKIMKVGDLTSYKKGFDFVRSICITVIIGAFAFCGFIYYIYVENSKEVRSKIYVMDKQGNTSIAVSAPIEQVHQWQITAAVKRAYILWNSFDKNSYSSNIENALEYFGASGKLMLKDYDDHQMLFELRDKNISYRAEIVKCIIDFDKMKGEIIGIQSISQNGVGIRRNLNVSFDIFDITPSEKNPEGVKIDNYNVTNDIIIE